MKRIFILCLLVFPVLAFAGPGWQVTTLNVAPGNAGAVVAAFDKLMNSKIGKEASGRLTLQAHIADGENPATHTVVSYYRSLAGREPYTQKMGASADWAEFLETLSGLGSQVGTYRGQLIKSWGDVSDSDVVWVDCFFTVSNPAVFVAALDQFRNSPTGQKIPGQVHLAAANMGGLGGPTHVVSVGFASEAEMEMWQDTAQNNNADWQAQLRELGSVSEYHGANLLRDVKSWGPLSLKEVSTRKQLAPLRGQAGVKLGSSWGQAGVKLGSSWGKPEPPVLQPRSFAAGTGGDGVDRSAIGYGHQQ